MNNYLISIQYDASNYNGWQKQHNTSNTIQETLETIISDFLNEKIELSASGRTDAGVHAKNQYANFHIKKEIDNKIFISFINTLLPDCIKINSIKKIHSNFHARLNAISKTYKYTIFSAHHNNVFTRKYCYYYNNNIDTDLMIAASKYLIGQHDFKAFTNSKDRNISTIRKINYIDITKNGNYIEIYINGNGFLYNMVRIIVGTLLLVGTNKISVNDVNNILYNKDRKIAGPMLPACGLCLWDVKY